MFIASSYYAGMGVEAGDKGWELSQLTRYYKLIQITTNRYKSLQITTNRYKSINYSEYSASAYAEEQRQRIQLPQLSMQFLF